MRKQSCWIATGRGRSLCSRHKRAVIELAVKWNIDQETAAFELRDFEIDVAEARFARVAVEARGLNGDKKTRWPTFLAPVAIRRSASPFPRGRGGSALCCPARSRKMAVPQARDRP
jgi:hypothetical protein